MKRAREHNCSHFLFRVPATAAFWSSGDSIFLSGDPAASKPTMPMCFPVTVNGWGDAEAIVRVAVPEGPWAVRRMESLGRAFRRRRVELSRILQEVVDEAIDGVDCQSPNLSEDAAIQAAVAASLQSLPPQPFGGPAAGAAAAAVAEDASEWVSIDAVQASGSCLPAEAASEWVSIDAVQASGSCLPAASASGSGLPVDSASGSGASSGGGSGSPTTSGT